MPQSKDNTLISGTDSGNSGGSPPPLHLSWLSGQEKQHLEIVTGVRVGRGDGCDVQIEDDLVSRSHLRLFPDAGTWHVEDLESTNGTFLDGVAVKQAAIPPQATIRLGNKGPKLWLKVEGAQPSVAEEEIEQHYFGDSSDEEVGQQTLMVRRAYRKVDKKQKRRYRGIIASVILLLLVTAGFGGYQYLMLQKTRELATEIFYSMKSVEVQIAQVENAVNKFGDAELKKVLAERRQEMRELEARYDHFLDELDVLGPDLSEEDRIILRVARIFGECELNMPADFKTEIKNYIEKWKTTGRLRKAIERLHDGDLAPVIYNAMVEKHLPPQFLYLALQESSFRTKAVGPKTRFGIAKGMWQFIPSTARRYGLRTGPLVELARFDPRDDRFNALLATESASSYLRDIYSKDAQASALLVMASYNWGPYNIRKRIRAMPENPRERNFWQLLKTHKIPKETYNYVLYIVSAAVIGENPSLFGFDFENPLTLAEKRLTQESK